MGRVRQCDKKNESQVTNETCIREFNGNSSREPGTAMAQLYLSRIRQSFARKRIDDIENTTVAQLTALRSLI